MTNVYQIESHHLPATSLQPGRRINHEPTAMLDILREEGNILAEQRSGVLNTYYFFPSNQWVPVDDESTAHFTLSLVPNTDRFYNVPEMSVDTLAVACDSMLRFVTNYSGAIAGFNNGYDMSGRRTAQSWRMNHFQHVIPPKRNKLQLLREIPRRMREPGSVHLERILADSFERYNGDMQGVHQILCGTAADIPRGNVWMDLEQMGAMKLATVIKQIDGIYSQVHRAFTELFVNNYDDVTSSAGGIPFQLRDEFEMRRKLQRFPFVRSNEEQRTLEFLMRSLSYFRRTSETPVDKRFIGLPAYSLSIAQGDEGVNLVFAPHLLGSTGILESRGMNLLRVLTNEVPQDTRKHRAQKIVTEMMCA